MSFRPREGAPGSLTTTLHRMTKMTRIDDPLLQCLLALCRYHGNASTAEAVMGGLPVRSS